MLGPYAIDDFDVAMRRRFGVGPVGAIVAFGGILAGHALVMNTAPAVQAVSAVGLLAIVVASQQPLVTLWLIMIGRTLVDMLWWVSTGGVLSSTQQIYSGGSFVLAIMLVLTQAKAIPIWHKAWFAAWIGVGSFGILSLGKRMLILEGIARFTAGYLLFAAAAALLDDVDKRRKFVLGITASLGIALLANLVMWSTGTMVIQYCDGYYRWWGPFSSFHSNAYAMAGLFPLLVLWWHDAHRWWTKAALVVTGVASISVLWMTYHRGPMVCLALFLWVLLLLRRQYALVIGLPLLVSALYIIVPEFRERFDDLFLFFEAEDERERMALGSGRLWIWTKTWAAYLESSAFAKAFGNGLGSQMTATGMFVDTHNEYLGLLYQHGPFALGLYFALQIAVLREAHIVWRRATEMFDRHFAEIMFAFTIGATSTNILSNAWVSRPGPAWLYLMMVGAMFAVRRDLPTRAAAPAPEAAVAPRLSFALPSAVGSPAK